MQRHAQDTLESCQLRLLEPPRHMPAVLDRPHPVLVQTTSPPNRGQVPRIVSPISRG